MNRQQFCSSTSRISPDQSEDCSTTSGAAYAWVSTKPVSDRGRKAIAPSQVQSKSTSPSTCTTCTIPRSLSATTLTFSQCNFFHFEQSRYSCRTARAACWMSSGSAGGNRNASSKLAMRAESSLAKFGLVERSDIAPFSFNNIRKATQIQCSDKALFCSPPQTARIGVNQFESSSRWRVNNTCKHLVRGICRLLVDKDRNSKSVD